MTLENDPRRMACWVMSPNQRSTWLIQEAQVRVHVAPLAPRRPGLDLGVLVGGVVVDDEMDVEVRGHAGVDMPQEGEELLVPVATSRAANRVVVQWRTWSCVTPST